MSFFKDCFLLSHGDGCGTIVMTMMIGHDNGGFKWPNSLLLFRNIFLSSHMMMMIMIIVILVVLDGLKTQNCNCHCLRIFCCSCHDPDRLSFEPLKAFLRPHSDANLISHALSSLLYHFGVTFFVKAEVVHICFCPSPPASI